MTMFAQERTRRWPAIRPATSRRAVLDLGSNSFHLLVADLTAGDPPVPIADVKCSVKLGEEALVAGVIGEDAWGRGLAAVDELARRARELSAPLTIIGTSVLRDTSNGAAFAAAVAARTGSAVEILSGEDEAKLAWYGARTTRPTGGTMTVLDLGGGSLEIAVGDDHGFLLMRSLPLGFLRVGTAAEVRDGASALAETVRALGPSAVVFTGGTARALARLMGTRGIRRCDLHVLLRKLANLDGAERLAFGVPFPRIDTIDAGGIVVATMMELLEVEYAQVADSGLREGVLTTPPRH